MNDLRSAAQAALEALDWLPTSDYTAHLWERQQPALHALRAALEAPQPRNQCGETCERAKLCATCARQIEPQPVGFIDERGVQWLDCNPLRMPAGTKLYAGPPQAQQPVRNWQYCPQCNMEYAADLQLSGNPGELTQPEPKTCQQCYDEGYRHGQEAQAQQPVPPLLSDEQIDKAFDAAWGGQSLATAFARAVERDVRRSFGIKEGEE